jgi:Ca2+-binding RTX toxin-like protein
MLNGGPGDDDLIGGDGDDELDGGSGDDKLDGGRGDDKLVAGPGDDDVDGGRGGADRIDTADAQAEHTLTCGQGGDRLTADGDDPINVDCETFDGGRAPSGTTSVSLPVACPGSCTSGRIVLTVAGKRLGEGKVGRGAARVRFNRRLAKGRKLRVRATIVARDSARRAYRSRGRYELRARYA